MWLPPPGPGLRAPLGAAQPHVGSWPPECGCLPISDGFQNCPLLGTHAAVRTLLSPCLRPSPTSPCSCSLTPSVGLSPQPQGPSSSASSCPPGRVAWASTWPQQTRSSSMTRTGTRTMTSRSAASPSAPVLVPSWPGFSLVSQAHLHTVAGTGSPQAGAPCSCHHTAQGCSQASRPQKAAVCPLLSLWALDPDTRGGAAPSET